MTAAAPDPRFRDQLASAIRRPGLGPEDGLGWEQDAVENLLPLIAAEVEARVQAAANQRAAEVLEEIAPDAPGLWPTTYNWLLDRAAALASPAPAPRAEEGQ